MLSFEEWKQVRKNTNAEAPTKTGAQNTGGARVMTFEEWKTHRNAQQEEKTVSPEERNRAVIANAKSALQEHQTGRQTVWSQYMEDYIKSQQPSEPVALEPAAEEVQETAAPTEAVQTTEAEQSTEAADWLRPENYDENTKRMYGELTGMEATLQEKVSALEQAQGAVESAEKTVTDLEAYLKELETAYQLTQGQQIYETYEKVYGQYSEAVAQYNQAYEVYQSAYSAYEPLYNSYAGKAEEYEKYLSGIKLYGDPENWGIAEYEYLANRAQEAYDAYLDSPEYRKKLQEVHGLIGPYIARDVQQNTMQSNASAGALDDRQDAKGAELRAIRDYYKQLLNEKIKQEVMAADLAELEGWSEEERAALESYIANRPGSFGSIVEGMGAALSGSGAARSAAANNAWKSQQAFQELSEKYGEEKVKNLAETLERHKNAQLTEQVEDYGTNAVKGKTGASVAHSVATIPANLAGAITSPIGALSSLTNRTGRYKTLDPNNMGNLFNVYSGAVRRQVGENISGDKYDELGNKVSDGGALRQGLSYGYQGMMSAADTLARAAMGGGSKVISLGLAATGSFGQTVSDASARGATPTQALLMGVTNSGLEVATEYLPLDEILKVAKGGPASVKQLLKNIFKQAVIEVTEEEVSYLGSLLAEAVILQDKSDYRQQIAQAVANGASYEEAAEQANWGIVLEAAETAITSAFSGGISASVSSGAANLKNLGAQKTTQQKTVNPDAHVELADPMVGFEKETWDLCDRLAKATGRNIKLYQNYGTEAGIDNGYYADGTIYVNTQSGDPVAQIISHELTHSVEFAQEYKELSRMVLQRIESLGGDLNQLRQETADLYAQNGHPLDSQQKIDQEIVAEYVAKNLLTDEQQIMEAARQNRTLIEKIKAWIDNLLGALGNRDAAERAYLTQVQSLYAKALQQTQSSAQQTAVQTAPVAGQTSPVAQTQEDGGVWDDDAVEVNWDDPAQVRTWAQNMLSSGQITGEEFNSYIDLAEQLAEEKSGRESFTERKNSISSGKKFSFAGANAKNANLQTLGEAKALDEQGVANETIRQQTGWFKGMDGKWRFEVDDSEMRYSKAGDALFSEMHPEYARHQELMESWLYGELSTEEETEFRELDEVWGREHQRLNDRVRRGNATLQNVLKHDALFEAYPELRGVKITFEEMESNSRGRYDPNTNTIAISENLRNAPESTLIHEIQHAIQNYEGFTSGSSVEYWKEQRAEIVETIGAARRNLDLWLDDIGYKEKLHESLMQVKNKEKTIQQHWEDMKNFKANSKYARKIAACEAEIAEFQRQYDEITGGMTVYEQYENTAGEIEARDVADRRNLTAEERKNTPPNLGDEDTVFAEGNGVSADYVGKTRDGIEVYETSEKVKNLPWKDRKKLFLQLMRNQYRGRTAKFVRNGHTYYAKFEYRDVSKNIYGDDSSDPKGLDAKINVGADGNIFELVEQSEYFLSEAERGKTQRMHRGVRYWDYFIKTVQIDGDVYDVLAHIRRKDSGSFVYDIEMYQNKEIEPSSPEDSLKGGRNRVPNSSAYSIQDGDGTVKRQMSISPAVNRKSVANDLRGILSRGGDVAELRRYISQLEQGGAQAERTGGNAYQMGASAERSGAQRIIQEAKRGGISVEEYLRQNWEQYDVDGQWNADARAALEQERRGRRYSISSKDNQGRQLTAQQQAHFADSQARDEDGNLVTVYHSSPTAGYTVLDGSKGKGNYKYGDYDGAITFFTDRKQMADSYAPTNERVDTRRRGKIADGVRNLKRTAKSALGKYTSGQYEGYVNITNPYVVDAEGSNWDNIHPEFSQELYENIKSLSPEEKAALRSILGGNMYHFAARVVRTAAEAEGGSGGDAAARIASAYRKVGDAEVLFEVAYNNFSDAAARTFSHKGSTTNDIVRQALEDGSYDGVIIRNVVDYGSFSDQGVDQTPGNLYITFNSNQFKAWDNTSPTRSRDIRYSISSKEEQGEQKTAEQIRSEMPTKASNYLMGAQRKLLTELKNKLGVNLFTNMDDLKGIVEEIADEYLTTGTVAQEKLELLFDKAYAGGIVKDAEFYEQYKEIKTHLRKTAVTISEGDSHDIADYQDFRKRNFGVLRIVKEGGLPVDSAYHELHEMAPELFPESITHPADQLVRMAEVARSIQVSEKNLDEYYGPERDSFRQITRHEFESAVADVMGDLRQVKRYIDDEGEAEETPPTTPEEAAGYYKQLKDARRVYEKAQAKNLLTEHDEMQLGKLLRGEIAPEDLDPEKDFVKGIMAVYEAKKEYERLCKLLAAYKRSVRAGYREQADRHLETANDWKDKKVGIAYSRETMERNIDDIVPNRNVAAAIKREYFEAVHVSEAQATRFKNQFRSRVRRMNLSTKISKGNLVSEAHAVQLLGEAEDNIRVMQNARGRMKVRDGKTLEEWRAVIRDLWAENPGLDQQKIRNAVEGFRKIYDELFEKMNEVRIRNGYEPVNYRQGYFPHFQPGEGDGILGAFGKALNIDTQVAALPTTINGLTHTFKPGIQWFGNAQERLGFNTAYDAVEGFDKYIEGVASVIYQTENIQKLRALAGQIRYRTSEEGIRRQVDEIRARDNLSEEEKQVQINSIYEHGGYTLSNFVTELDEYTNLLANKKSKLDRTMEAMMGRRAYVLMKAWESRVGANMIAGNISSALTNVIPLTQAGAQLDKGSLIKGMAATLKAIKEDDGIVGRSTFLTNRRGSDPLVQTWTQKASKKMGILMEVIDGFTSDSIVRAAYFQNLKRGLSGEEALHQADVFASHVMADRSKGAMPTLFESTNPIFKAFTQFQLEVNNQFSEVFKDLPRAHRERGLMSLALVLLKYFFGAFLYNEAYEYFVGRRPALDPFGILNDTVGDLSGYELPNLVEWGVNAIRGKETSFETEKVGLGEAGKNLASTVLGELPFSSGLTLVGIETDGGRIPASSAVPDLTALWDAAMTEGWSAEKRWKEIQDELDKLSYVLTPFGGNQAGKLIKGVKAFAKGGSYTVDAEGNDILQYPVYKDSPASAIGKAVKMGLLGKSSIPEAQEWVESGFDSLNADQTAVYQELVEAGAGDRDSYALIRELEQAGKLKGTEKKAAQQAALASAPMTDDEKALAMSLILGKELTTEKGNPTPYANFLTAASRGLGVDEFMDMRTKGVDVEEYLEATDAGLNSADAVELAYDMYDLDEKEDAENVEYWRLAVDASSNEGMQLALMGGRMSEATFKKATMAYELDVSPDMFVTYYETRDKYDADGNNNYTNAEVKAVIDAMGKGYTNEQKGVLWQMATGSTSTKNNPYSKSAGQKWLDAKNAAKEKE